MIRQKIKNKDVRHKQLNDRDIKGLEAYHRSRHTNIEKDDVNLMVVTPEFLKGVEKNGNLRATLHDLGFDMDQGHDEITDDTIYLEDGYRRFNYKKQDFETVKGVGAGKVLIQGVR